MARPVGICRLCLRLGCKLCESHVVPAWAYEHVRESKPEHPILIADGRAVETSKQTKEYLLCDECEQRLGRDDNYASTIALRQDGSTAALDHVRKLPYVSRDGVFTEAEPTTLDTDRMLRFGVSVVWRGHICRYVRGCYLGDRYAEEIRRFLLGESSFPENAACILILIEGSPADRSPVDMMFGMPSTVRHDGYDTHRVVVCGLHFDLAVGARIDPSYRTYCLARRKPRRVIVSTSELVVDSIVQQVFEAKPAGKLAREENRSR